MKKLYTILLSAAVALGASAATETVSLQLSNADGLKTIAETETSISRTALRNTTLTESFAAKGATTQRKAAPAKAPEATDWTSIGEGTYLEDFLTIYSDVDANQMWKVTVETSASNPGWYRFQPYASGPIAELLGSADNTYMYINATDPQKVIAEDLVIFNSWLASQVVVENEWTDAPDDNYGTLSDNVISFPVGSFYLYANNGWSVTTKNTGCKLFLPGAEVKDYAFKASSVYCSDKGYAECRLTSGADVASIKVYIIPGFYPINGNEAVVNTYGQEVSSTITTLTFTPSEKGLYSFLLVALDAEGTIVGSGQAYAFWNETDDSDWVDCGTVSFNEGIYTSNYGDGMPALTLTAPLQESISKPGYFRIKDAYSQHTELSALTHTTHSHYIYFDATDPDFVYIEPSTLGVGTSWGHGAILSFGWRLAQNGQIEEGKANGYGGKYDTATKKITFPENDMYLGEEDYNGGNFLRGSDVITFDMSGYSAINNVLSDADADVNAPVEFFNLQGVRVANPTEGQLVIRRQGTKVEKVVLK